MLYELVAIVRPGDLNVVKSVAQTTGAQILRSGGVVRGLTNWGTFSLPRVVRAHQARHASGHYFVMRFDSSPTVQTELRESMRLDPRMIRHSVVKVGNGTLESIKDINGRVDWNQQAAEE